MAIPPNMPLWGSPYFLCGLSHVTLPTASFYNPHFCHTSIWPPRWLPVLAPVYLQHSSRMLFIRCPPFVLQQRALHRPASTEAVFMFVSKGGVSLASLPSLPSLFSTSMTPLWLQFQNDNKEGIDHLSARKIELRRLRRSGPEFIKNAHGILSKLPSVSSYLVHIDLSPEHLKWLRFSGHCDHPKKFSNRFVIDSFDPTRIR